MRQCWGFFRYTLGWPGIPGMRTPPAGRSGRTVGGRGFLCVLEIFCRGRFHIGPQRVEKPPVFPFGSRLRLNCRAGVHARRTADFAKKADVLCFLNLRRFGGRNRPPYDARQTLCHRETIGFFDSLGGRIYIGPVCGGGDLWETTDPVTTATYVGDDACIVPGNPAAPEGPREGHGPPLQTTENDRPNRTAATARATVGRDALIPPDPAAGQTPRAG